MEPGRVVLGGFFTLMGDALRRILEAEGAYAIAGTAADWRESLRLVHDLEPDLLLLDRRLGRTACLEVARAVRAQSARTGLVVLAGEPDVTEAGTLFDAGVGGYVSKDVTDGQLLAAMRAGQDGPGQVLVVVAPTGVGLTPNGADMPTPQERRVLQLIADGMATHQIAGFLGCTEGTVQYHVQHLYAKLRVHGRTALVRAARERGWLD